MNKEFGDLFKLNEEERKIARSYEVKIRNNPSVEEISAMLAWLIKKHYTDPKSKISIRLAKRLSDIELFLVTAECRYISPGLRKYVTERIFTRRASYPAESKDEIEFDESTEGWESDLPF